MTAARRLRVLLLGAASLWLLGILAKSMISSPALAEFDTGIVDRVYLQRYPTARTILEAIDFIGHEGMIVVGVLVAILFLQRQQWYYLIVWGIALVGGHFLNDQLKDMVARPRPVFEQMWITENTYGFPSGHAMTAILVSGMLAYFLVIGPHPRRYRALVLMTAALVVLIIGCSRLLLGLHYLTDVLAGYIAGGIWVAACIITLETIRRQNSHLRGRTE
jgi:undecaprenyl-diphosphatase